MVSDHSSLLINSENKSHCLVVPPNCTQLLTEVFIAHEARGNPKLSAILSSQSSISCAPLSPADTDPSDCSRCHVADWQAETLLDEALESICMGQCELKNICYSFDSHRISIPCSINHVVQQLEGAAHSKLDQDHRASNFHALNDC